MLLLAELLILMKKGLEGLSGMGPFSLFPVLPSVRKLHEEAGLLKCRAQCRIHGHRYDEGYDRVDRGGDEVDLQGQIRCRLSEDENFIPVADDRVCKHVEDQTAGSGDDGPA